jgi:chloramphenicol-sensitive protein RarD
MRYSPAMAGDATTTERAHVRTGEPTSGLLLGLGAYSLWGLFPIYFKAVAAAPPLEMLAHRVVWALILLLAVSWRQGRLGELGSALRSGRTAALLGASTVLIAINWLVYIWAVVNGRILEGSLGYYINPLVNVLLGVVVLKERLERPVLAAVLVAGAGVVWLSLQVGHPPWVSLTLAASFGLYGLLRKLAPVGAVTGLAIETALLTPPAIVYLLWARDAGRLVFGTRSLSLDVLLLLAGPITAAPLLLFTAAARRLRLSTLGLLQYVSPTLQFLVAVGLYGEAFTAARGVAFACIWTALVLFAVHTVRRGRAAPATEA